MEKTIMKKALPILLSLLLVLSVVTSIDNPVVQASTTSSWNFKDSDFKSLGTISSTVTVDNLSLIATSSKTMEVKADSQTVSGTSYTYCLATGGSGSTSYRAVKVPVSGTDTIKVILMSSGSSSRTLTVANSSGTALGTMTAGTTASQETYSYSGSAGYVYLYSSGSNINIYKIQVDSSASTTASTVTTSTAPSSTTTTTTTSTSSSWNFKDSGFNSLGTISSNVTVSNLTLLATSSKTMTVQADSQTVDSTSYTYCLATGGSGSTSYRAVKVPVSGSDTIKVVLKSSGSSSRTLVVANSSGTQLGTMTAGTSASTASYSYSGSSGYVYLYSSGSNINIYKIQVDSKGTTTTTTTTPSTTTSTSPSPSASQSTSDGTVVTSYSALVSAVASVAKAGGGTVYVKGTTISCTGQIALSTSNANVSIVGVQNSDGTYPVLDFSSFLSSYIGKSTSDSQVGIRITGSYYTIKNLIVQKAPDNGIQIKGSSAGNNTIQNCVVRYNNDAGLQITGGAYSNTIKYVCSYRNCDVYTLGGNADGYAPKLAAGKGNTFYCCYAWDNSDDGWDSYDKTDGLTYDLSYEECACWNNGNPEVFTGQYDFENGDALDTDLLLVSLITAKDSTFATKYASGTFSLPTSSFVVTEDGTLTVAKWTGSNYGGNPNGFKFGSVNTTSSCTRTVKNCLSFDHTKKGFDNNNSACTAYFSNCVSFDNGYNYYISPFTMKSWSNVLGFSGSSSDKLPSGYSVTTPSSSTQSTIRSTVTKTKNSIIATCQSNKIPGAVFFDIYD